MQWWYRNDSVTAVTATCTTFTIPVNYRTLHVMKCGTRVQWWYRNGLFVQRGQRLGDTPHTLLTQDARLSSLGKEIQAKRTSAKQNKRSWK